MQETSEAQVVATSPPELANRIVRYEDLRPCTTAFIDARTPGSDKKENFTIIGPGVSESPDQHVHIDIPHGFNVGAARQPPGCVNSQHSHDTAEVFIVHSSRWAFYVGEQANEAQIVLDVGDTISIPTQVFRGFENIGNEVGFMFAVLGEDDPGRVTWAPSVFEAAQSHGLVLLENGQLADSSASESIPQGVNPMPVTTREEAEGMRSLTSEDLQACTVRHSEFAGRTLESIGEYPIIGVGVVEAELPDAKLGWQHGFSLRLMRFAPGAATKFEGRAEEQVLLIHSGSLLIEVSGGETKAGPGDVVTLPVQVPRRFHNAGDTPAEVFVVYRGDQVPLVGIEN